MKRDLKHDDPRNYRGAKAKVKSGCRTCKIRKVKCDESFPVCHRCMTSGRICDGYGVWGGGGNLYGQRQHPPSRSIARSPATSPLSICLNSEETLYLEWFRHRTARKIPGAFALQFWQVLIFQATWNEPAVLHAILTLSSVHKSNVPGSSEHQSMESIPGRQERFMLQQYTKAIHFLQPLFSAKDKAFIRVALITCVLFISLELLRGRFKAAQDHLEGGLKVLRESTILQFSDGSDTSSTSSRSGIDIWITEAFARMQTQVELFRRTYSHPFLLLQPLKPIGYMRVFSSMEEAWQPLEQLLNYTLQLTEKKYECLSTGAINSLLDEQRKIQDELTRWLMAYEASRENLYKLEYARSVCILLELYHTMANIMAGTCLSYNNETVFDSFTDQFVYLLRRSIRLRQIGSSHSQVLSRLVIDMSRSMIDVGWIPPLYYMAIKCRVHRLRLHAIRLLESASHREGIWDSRIATCVAKQVMEIEEQGFYRNIGADDDFPLDSYPTLQDLSLPVSPGSRRISELRISLFDDPREGVSLSYRQDGPSESWTNLNVSLGNLDI